MDPRRLAAMLLATLFAAASCTGAAPGGGGTSPAGKPATGGNITFVLEDDPINFDPFISRAFIDRNVHYQMYDSLVRINAKGEIIPWLAETWKLSDDGKRMTFTLRKDVKYHDGTPFDAESVKWNIDRYRSKESARRGELASVASEEVVDANTIHFHLTSPFAPLLANLVDRAGMMLSRKAVEAGGQDFTRKPLGAGTGPFKFVEAVKNDHITLEKNPEWWGKDKDGNKLPYLDKIIIKPITDSTVRFTNLRTGDAQVANGIPGKDVSAAKAESALTYQEIPGLSFGSLIPNEKAGFVFSDKRYVKAVSMALDRKEILEKVFFGVGVVGYGTIAPPHFAYDANFKPFEKPDPEGAKKLVAAVGKGALTFELLISSGDPIALQLAQLIQAQVKKADITAEIKQLEFAQILKLQDEKAFLGLTQIGWSGRIDPDGNTYDHVYSARPFNDSSYSNKDVDKLLDDQRATPDPAKRRELLRRAEQIYVVDDPARIWYRFGIAQLVTSKRLQGLEPYPDQIIRFQFAWLQR